MSDTPTPESCLSAWLRFESSPISDDRQRQECERLTRELCEQLPADGQSLGVTLTACLLHCLLSGGCLEETAIGSLNASIAHWRKAGIKPEYSESLPTPSSLLELYSAALEALPLMGHPQAGILNGWNP